jgi:asparagine synthase (glutamine-hydrolysing)
MRPRYLLLVADREAVAAATVQIAARTGLAVAHSAYDFAVLTNQACNCVTVDPEAVAIGTLFPKQGPARAVTALGEAERAHLSRHGFPALLDAWWGGYVGVRSRDGRINILRDPSGALPCYRAEQDGSKLFASDLALLQAASGRSFAVAWEALGRILYAAGLPTPETALAGICDLRAGDILTLDGAAEQTTIGWSPWAFADPRGEEGSATTAERLRRVVEHCVAGWASLYQRPLLSLSGGLDSSIVAACLGGARPGAECLTLYTDDAAGDERAFAQQVCDAIDLPLSEHRYDLDTVDLSRPLGAHLPRPAGRVEAQPYEAAHRALARQIGADAFFTGNGGDNVFCYSQSAAALADRALHEGPGAGAFATLQDICRQTGAGPLRVTRAAMRLARQPRGYRWKPNPRFLHPDFVASLADAPLTHPWLEAPGSALPGKTAHIAALVRAQLTLESDRSQMLPVVNPLLSQPIMEACLAIPSWRWREGGRDRAMARAAFADRLPSVVVERRMKGTPDPFCGEIVQRKREELRARLLDGLLTHHGILDNGAIEETLRPGRPTTGEENVRLLELANVEAWLSVRSSRSFGADTTTSPSTLG